MGDDQFVRVLASWAEAATQQQGADECRRLRDRLTAASATTVELTHGVFVDGAFAGAIGTCAEHFNVMWLHWDYTGRGIGPRAAHIVLEQQLTQHGRAIVNQPNERMRKALLKVITPERAAQRRSHAAFGALLLEPGDLRAL